FFPQPFAGLHRIDEELQYSRKAAVVFGNDEDKTVCGADEIVQNLFKTSREIAESVIQSNAVRQILHGVNFYFFALRVKKLRVNLGDAGRVAVGAVGAYEYRCHAIG